MSFKERLNILYRRLFVESPKKEISKLYNEEDGFFPRPSQIGLVEFTNSIRLFMQRFGIGRYIKIGKWGKTKTDEIRQVLYNTFDKSNGSVAPTKTSTSPIELYDQLKDSDAYSNKFTDYDYERVARTESARIKAVAQLLMYKEAGVKYVIHKTKHDARVSQICKSANNREFEIGKLLNNENLRIPLHVNCRCHYIPSTKDL